MEFAPASDLSDAAIGVGTAGVGTAGVGTAGVGAAGVGTAGVGTAGVGVGCGADAGSVCVGQVDEVGLSDEKLRLRLGVLGRAESTLAAMKSRVLAELSRRHSKGDAQR
nr:hypothetical protein [Acidimicrobiia bacterium]